MSQKTAMILTDEGNKEKFIILTTPKEAVKRSRCTDGSTKTRDLVKEFKPRDLKVGWAKHFESSLFIAYCRIAPSSSSSSSEPEKLEEIAHEICDKLFDNVDVPLAMKMGNLKPYKQEDQQGSSEGKETTKAKNGSTKKAQKEDNESDSDSDNENNDSDSGSDDDEASGKSSTSLKIPFMPSYLFDERRAYYYWKDIILPWWGAARKYFTQKERRMRPQNLYAGFVKNHPKFRTVEQGKRWLLQIITREEQAFVEAEKEKERRKQEMAEEREKEKKLQQATLGKRKREEEEGEGKENTGGEGETGGAGEGEERKKKRRRRNKNKNKGAVAKDKYDSDGESSDSDS